MLPDRHEDSRGVIQDLLTGPIDCVTEIFSRQGAIRGNHVHMATTQWVYVAWGELRVAWIEDDGKHEKTYGPGSFIKEPAGTPHAWCAESDCMVLVFTRGPRSGENYESDTIRLEVPILT